MNSPKVMEILSMIREKRILLGISQEVFSEKLEISQSAYYALETGKTEISVNRLLILIDLLKQESILMREHSKNTFIELDNISKQLDILR